MLIFDNKEKIVDEKNVSKSWYVPCIMFGSAFLMYLIALLPIFVKRGLPFFYYGDYNVQQVPFYILAHRAVRSGEFFWNWNVDLGGPMAGDFSFYLWGSPFFWLTVPFSEKAIPYLMPLLMALKYATAATCGYLYIRRYVQKYIYAMLGGYLFAFSGFNACNIVFNHFTDSVAFLSAAFLCQCTSSFTEIKSKCNLLIQVIENIFYRYGKTALRVIDLIGTVTEITGIDDPEKVFDQFSYLFLIRITEKLNGIYVLTTVIIFQNILNDLSDLFVIDLLSHK